MTLPADAEKRTAVETMFDRIARDYDRMNRLMTLGLDRRWRSATIDVLALRGGERVLDLACGTGDLAIEARRAGARVSGIDFSTGMLAVARERAATASRARGATNGRDREQSLVRGDALELPFRKGSFDAIVSGFALRNFTDLEAAFAECARVLREDGRFALLEIDTPRQGWIRAGHRLWFHGVVPALGRLFADANAYSYLPASVVYLPEEPRLRSMLVTAGFIDIAKRSFVGGAVQLVAARRAKGGGHG